ncbi:unnamed protein product [Brachionus calyciflorus]|uniref:PAS fold-3 domain-containing protein n=1 Tax=Brachionus calyciflorus TaxID=104777 RepID=A0A813ZK12_9BILA|nr:unnamed protein product [Brachionus calyciflorus]
MKEYELAIEIIGYSAIEMIGTCGYDYCHLDDLEKLIDCHKKLLQNGAVPIIAYRFRTKGLQWLWIQSRFQIMYHQTAMKPYAIISYNHVIGLNEMVESKDLLDVKAFYSNESTISLAADNETKQDDTKDPQWTNNPIQNSNNQETKNVDLVNMSSNKHEIKPDKHIDESLGSIFLRSFNDIDYRNYVLNQFKMKKQKIENTIRQHQEELNILEETMDNIRDEKKLASWVMEFQRQEYNNNLYKNVSNKSQKSDQQSESSSSKETQQNQQPIRNNQNQLQHNQPQQQQQQHRQSYPPNEQLMIQTNQYQDQHKIDKNIQSKTSTLLIQKQQQGNNERNFNMKSEYTDAMENNQIMSSNKSAKRTYSSSPQSSRNANFNEEAELVGELISIRKTMPKSFNENKTVNQRDFNNNNNTTTTTITTTNNNVKNQNQLRLKNNISLSNLQSSMEFEDMNSEMIDKLLNNYNFETFTDQ